APHARRPRLPVLLGRPLRPRRRPGDDRDRPGRRPPRRALSGDPARQHVVRLARLHQPPDQPHRRPGAHRPGRPAAVRDQRARPGRRQLAGVHRAPARLRADPLAAAVPGPGARGRAAGRGGSVRRPAGRAAVLSGGAGDARGLRCRDRRPPGCRRRADAGLMALLTGQVVVVSGVGPGLGRSIALASARAGADVVVAARTASRLDEVAKEVTALGRRGVAVPADVTDGESAARLAEATLAAFGRVDALVHNAFAIPLLTSLADADLDAIRAAVETNAIAALRLTRLFTPALAASRGSVVMINSAVLRHSRPGFGGYKMAKTTP